MRFNHVFFGLFSSKSKLLNAETRILESGHFTVKVLFLAERFEFQSSSKFKPRPDSRTSPTGWRALGRGALKSSSEGYLVTAGGT